MTTKPDVVVQCANCHFYDYRQPHHAACARRSVRSWADPFEHWCGEFEPASSESHAWIWPARPPQQWLDEIREARRAWASRPPQIVTEP